MNRLWLLMIVASFATGVIHSNPTQQYCAKRKGGAQDDTRHDRLGQKEPKKAHVSECKRYLQPEEVTSFTQLLAFCRARSRNIATARAYKKHAQGWSQVKRLAPFVPQVRFDAQISRLAAIARESFQPRWQTFFENVNYYSRSAGFVVGWQFNGFQELFESADIDSQAMLACSTYAHESVAFAVRLFMIVTMLKLYKEAVDAHRKQIKAYERYYKILVERSRSGDVINEQTRDDLTLGQLTSRKAEAYGRFADATEKYNAYAMEFESMTDGLIDIEQISIPMPPVPPASVNLEAFMRRDLRLAQAWSRVRSTRAAVGRANTSAFAPRAGLEARIMHRYDFIGALKFDIPMDFGVTFHFSLNILNLREQVSTAQHTSEYNKARSDYENQHRNSRNDALKRKSNLQCNPPAIKAQQESLQENRRDMHRYAELLRSDASDHIALQKYADAIARYTETVARYETLLQPFVESCFLLEVPLDRTLRSMPCFVSSTKKPLRIKNHATSRSNDMLLCSDESRTS
jgi:outer membrane protein TolC